MNNLSTIFLFFFIFSILTISKLVFNFISALVQNPPKRLLISTRELILYGVALSYILTYIIQK